MTTINSPVSDVFLPEFNGSAIREDVVAVNKERDLNVADSSEPKILEAEISELDPKEIEVTTYDYSILSNYLDPRQIAEFTKDGIDPSVVVEKIKSRPNRILEQIQALDLLPALWQLTPVSPTKKPYIQGWQKQGDERKKIKDALKSQRAWGFGLITGHLSGGIMAIDCDGESAHQRLLAILGVDIPTTVSFSSGTPGRCQLLFLVEEKDWGQLKKRVSENTGESEQLEFRWDNHQSVLPPSFHPKTGSYHWVNSPDHVPIAPLPVQILEYLTASPEPKVLTPSPPVPKKRGEQSGYVPPIPLDRCLSKASSESLENGVTEGGRDNAGAALARDLIGTAGYLDSIGQAYEGDTHQMLNDFCQRCSPSLSDSDCERIYKSAQSSSPSPSKPNDKINERISYWVWENSGKPKRTSSLHKSNAASEHNLGVADYEILAQKLGFKLVLNHKDEIQSKLIQLTLDLFHLVGSTLKFNLMSREYELAGEQIDVNNAQSFIAQKLGYDASTEKCILAIHAIANQHAYHPVRDYLDGLKNQPELVDFDVLENMATLFFGNSDPLANKMMAKKLIGSVARVHRPGCKDDTLLVLQGKQGERKSTFLSVLATPDWFCDDIRDLDNKDELAKLSRNWILELAEVDYLMGRKEVESFKRFLSTTTDTYRPPYGRANIRIDRSCSFFATTNKSEFLADPTGDRRYWVVEVMQKIDCELVATYRDMIWATALAAYERGDDWWLSEQEDISRSGSHSKYRESDPWVDVILGGESKLPTTSHGTGEYIRVEQIFVMLGLTPIQRDRKASNRVVKVLTELGFESRTLRVGSKTIKAWYRECLLPISPVLPILKKIGNNHDSVDTPLLPLLPMLPSFKDHKNKKEENTTPGASAALQQDCFEKEIDLLPISEKIGNIGFLGNNFTGQGVQPLPISKKIGNREDIGNSPQFKVGDRVQYVGSNVQLAKQYAGELLVHEIGPDGITCLLASEKLSSWIDPDDLQLLD